MSFLNKTGLTKLWTKIKATFALKTHTHSASDITSGTIAPERVNINKLSLGAFDEITSVSGTTYTIKRQTGYCNYSRSIMALYQDGNKNMQFGSTGGGYRWGTDYHSILPDEVVDIILYQRDSSGVVQSTSDAIIHSPIKFYLTDGNANWARGDLNSLSDHFCSLNAKGITSFDDYWNFFRFNDVIIEYRTSNYYEEDITI